MTMTAKKQHKFLHFESELPMPGQLTPTTKIQTRHGMAWDLRAFDGKGEPPVRIIKGNALEGSSTQQS